MFKSAGSPQIALAHQKQKTKSETENKIQADSIAFSKDFSENYKGEFHYFVGESH